jgi:hypothetical protein
MFERNKKRAGRKMPTCKTKIMMKEQIRERYQKEERMYDTNEGKEQCRKTKRYENALLLDGPYKSKNIG